MSAMRVEIERIFSIQSGDFKRPRPRKNSVFPAKLHSMLCISIIGPTLDLAAAQIRKAEWLADSLELRLDLFCDYNTADVKKLRSKLPLICKGGQLADFEILQPTFIDTDYRDTPPDFPAKHILSYHNFDHTPSDLEKVLLEMQRKPAHLYKIACRASSTLDALRMLDFVRTHPGTLGICMGEKGTLTRLLGVCYGNPWTYAALCSSHRTAEGQLTARTHRFTYPLKPQSIYGLLGGTVSQSPSHYTHNRYFRSRGIDAIYVKLTLETEELADFFPLIDRLGFKGLSITTPFKEQILPFIENHAPQIGAVNTLVGRKGYNTDGIGALDAIESHLSVRNKQIVVLGAGGAARALIYEAKKRGGLIHLVNRTREKAKKLALEFGTTSGELKPYDILINTTSHPMPLSSQWVLPGTVVMDIKTQTSELLQIAREKGCIPVYGYDMFFRQAGEQFKLWGLKPPFPLEIGEGKDS